jgi:DNA processing protein
MENTLLYPNSLKQQLALVALPGIGSSTVKKIVDANIRPEALLTYTKKDLQALGLLNRKQIDSLSKNSYDQHTYEQTIKTLKKFRLQPIFITDALYPQRLLECNDPPMMLFSRGVHQFNQQKVLSIIGTRNNTAYGHKVVQQIVAGLSEVPDLVIISGLADGIDTIAHKAALKNQIPTIGVLGHGHDVLYPATNRTLAKEMLLSGSIIAEYLPYAIPDKANFPMRNRIVAGMSDVVLIVESGQKGGALITAKLANGYNRTVAAIPGNIFEPASVGCNNLLIQQLAVPVSCAEDIMMAMNWDVKQKTAKQAPLYVDFTTDEQLLLQYLSHDKPIHIDDLLKHAMFDYSNLANLLLNLELKNAIISFPGKRWCLQRNVGID